MEKLALEGWKVAALAGVVLMGVIALVIFFVVRHNRRTTLEERALRRGAAPPGGGVDDLTPPPETIPPGMTPAVPSGRSNSGRILAVVNRIARREVIGGALILAVMFYFALQMGKLSSVIEGFRPQRQGGVTTRSAPDPKEGTGFSSAEPEKFDCSRCTASGTPTSSLVDGIVVYVGDCRGFPGCTECIADYGAARRDETTGLAVGGVCRSR